jgi:iron complex transport system substrate-binding protein
MKTTKIIITLMVMNLSLMWAGGAQDSSIPPKNETNETSITIQDSLGRTVVLPGVPERIVQAGSSAFLVNDALFLFPEARERVVGMADGNQGRGNFLPIVDSSYDEKIIFPRTINIEEILSASPDLVIMKDFLFSKYDKEFQKVGLPVIYMDLESPEAWEKDLAILGQIFGNPQRAMDLQNLFSEYTMKVVNPLEGLKSEDRKKSLILYYSEKDGTGAFQVPPLTFIQTKMLEMTGSDPVWTDADMGTRWTTVGFEQIAAWNPDQIFLISYRTPVSEVLNIMKENPYWMELSVNQGGEIHPFPMDFHSWDQPDPRWLLGLQWMAFVSHNEIFPETDMNLMAQQFFADFYDVSEEDYINRIYPILEGLE